MKRSRPLIGLVQAIITGTIALLGFSCDKESHRRDEYGVPTARYIIKGTARDSIQGTPVSHIRLSTLTYEHPQLNYYPSYNVRDITDETGKFLLATGQIFGYPDIPIEVFDNEGRYQTDTLYVSFEGEKFINGSGSWYRGEATKEITVLLREKEPESMVE